VGGVLLASSMPRILDLVAAQSPRSRRQLRRFFNHTLRDELWSGRTSEPDFWAALLAFAEVPPEHAERLRASVPGILTPLPAMARLCVWSALTEVVVLSNHRHEWVLPALERAGVAGCVRRMLISSRVGAVKPDPEAYAPLLALPHDPGRMLVVDDRPVNLRAAAALGLDTLLADEDGAWIGRLDALLTRPPSDAAWGPARHGQA
jgi:putative hydrolase of the HAD superfamily